MIKQRQKIIRLADESELGWKVVDEYMQSEIASDEEDQKKIHRAQARARVKAKSEAKQVLHAIQTKAGRDSY